jgi:hypothetical protein
MSKRSYPTKCASKKMLEAYATGRAVGIKGLVEYVYSDARNDAFLGEDDVLEAFFNAGLWGTGLPIWTIGWRYGHLPNLHIASGARKSWNFRDQKFEAGVSMMRVAGSDHRPDATYELFNREGKTKVLVEGWLVTHTTGADGEPLMVGAVETGQVLRP